jgi:PII-like signaling protein
LRRGSNGRGHVLADSLSAAINFNMHLPHDAMLLRIFIGESDRWNHKPLYEAIILKARESQLAGATVLRGPMGFGKSSVLHTAKVLRLSMDLPMVIEIVDTNEKIQGFLPFLDQVMKGGLVTLEPIQVIDYRGNPEQGSAEG